MGKILVRIVALILVPCLLTDPVSAASFGAGPALVVHSGFSGRSEMNEQALTVASVMFFTSDLFASTGFKVVAVKAMSQVAQSQADVPSNGGSVWHSVFNYSLLAIIPLLLIGIKFISEGRIPSFGRGQNAADSVGPGSTADIPDDSGLRTPNPSKRKALEAMMNKIGSTETHGTPKSQAPALPKARLKVETKPTESAPVKTAASTTPQPAAKLQAAAAAVSVQSQPAAQVAVRIQAPVSNPVPVEKPITPRPVPKSNAAAAEYVAAHRDELLAGLRDAVTNGRNGKTLSDDQMGLFYSDLEDFLTALLPVLDLAKIDTAGESHLTIKIDETTKNIIAISKAMKTIKGVTNFNSESISKMTGIKQRKVEALWDAAVVYKDPNALVSKHPAEIRAIWRELLISQSARQIIAERLPKPKAVTPIAVIAKPAQASPVVAPVTNPPSKTQIITVLEAITKMPSTAISFQMSLLKPSQVSPPEKEYISSVSAPKSLLELVQSVVEWAYKGRNPGDFKNAADIFQLVAARFPEQWRLWYITPTLFIAVSPSRPANVIDFGGERPVVYSLNAYLTWLNGQMPKETKAILRRIPDFHIDQTGVLDWGNFNLTAADFERMYEENKADWSRSLWTLQYPDRTIPTDYVASRSVALEKLFQGDNLKELRQNVEKLDMLRAAGALASTPVNSAPAAPPVVAAPAVIETKLIQISLPAKLIQIMPAPIRHAIIREIKPAPQLVQISAAPIVPAMVREIKPAQPLVQIKSAPLVPAIVRNIKPAQPLVQIAAAPIVPAIVREIKPAQALVQIKSAPIVSAIVREIKPAAPLIQIALAPAQANTPAVVIVTNDKKVRSEAELFVSDHKAALLRQLDRAIKKGTPALQAEHLRLYFSDRERFISMLIPLFSMHLSRPVVRELLQVSAARPLITQQMDLLNQLEKALQKRPSIRDDQLAWLGSNVDRWSGFLAQRMHPEDLGYRKIDQQVLAIRRAAKGLEAGEGMATVISKKTGMSLSVVRAHWNDAFAKYRDSDDRRRPYSKQTYASHKAAYHRLIKEFIQTSAAEGMLDKYAMALKRTHKRVEAPAPQPVVAIVPVAKPLPSPIPTPMPAPAIVEQPAAAMVRAPRVFPMKPAAPPTIDVPAAAWPRWTKIAAAAVVLVAASAAAAMAYHYDALGSHHFVNPVVDWALNHVYSVGLPHVAVPAPPNFAYMHTPVPQGLQETAQSAIARLLEITAHDHLGLGKVVLRVRQVDPLLRDVLGGKANIWRPLGDGLPNAVQLLADALKGQHGFNGVGSTLATGQYDISSLYNVGATIAKHAPGVMPPAVTTPAAMVLPKTVPVASHIAHFFMFAGMAILQVVGIGFAKKNLTPVPVESGAFDGGTYPRSFWDIPRNKLDAMEAESIPQPAVRSTRQPAQPSVVNRHLLAAA